MILEVLGRDARVKRWCSEHRVEVVERDGKCPECREMRRVDPWTRRRVKNIRALVAAMVAERRVS